MQRLNRAAFAAVVVLAHGALVWLFLQGRVPLQGADSALVQPLVTMFLERPPAITPDPEPSSTAPPVVMPRISWAPPDVEVAFEEKPDPPRADRDAAQPEPRSASQAGAASAGSGTAPEGLKGGGQGLTIVERVLPRYPERSVRLGEEGTVVVHVQVNEKGRVSDIRVARGSGHQRLDSAALAAVRRWKFIPATQGSRAVSTWGETELRFVLYPFVFSRVAEKKADFVGDEQVKAGSGEVATPGGAAGLRRFIEDFSDAGFAGTATESERPELAKFRAALHEWGTVEAVEFKSTFGDHRWTRYEIKPQYRTGSIGETVDLKWDIYEVRHERGTSLWRIALDRNGTVWAAQARDARVSP